MIESDSDRQSSDHLASLYLRGRDVPCPVCRYNRRDGTTASCPECGYILKLEPIKPFGTRRPNRLLIATAVLMLVNASLLIPGLGFQIYQSVMRGWGFPMWTITNTLTGVGFVFAAVMACFALTRLASTRHDPVRPMLVGGIVLLALLLPEAIVMISSVL